MIAAITCNTYSFDLSLMQITMLYGVTINSTTYLDHGIGKSAGSIAVVHSALLLLLFATMILDYGSNI